MQRRARESVLDPSVHPQSKARTPPHGINPAILEYIDVEDFPEQLQGFADDGIIFLNCLNEFPEFTEEVINNSLVSLDGDLKVRIINLVKLCILLFYSTGHHV